MNLGIARLAAKLPAAAVTSFQRARELDPDDKDARALLISTLESLGRTSDAAAIRAEAPENVGRTSQPNAQAANAQDPEALAKLARVSRKFDRALLRGAGEVPAARPTARAPRKAESSGGPR